MSKYTKKQIEANRKAWLEALRSGKYKQTKGKLKSRNGSYCCLGVLCEVAEIPRVYDSGNYYYGTPDVLQKLKGDDLNAIQPADWDYYSDTSLPLPAMEWLGVKDEGPFLATPVTVVDKYGDEEQVRSLISLNDDYGWSFEQIADAVEKYGLKE